MDRVEESAIGRARRVEAFVYRDWKSDKNLWCWRCRCQTHHCPRLGNNPEIYANFIYELVKLLERLRMLYYYEHIYILLLLLLLLLLILNWIFFLYYCCCCCCVIIISNNIYSSEYCVYFFFYFFFRTPEPQKIKTVYQDFN